MTSSQTAADSSAAAPSAPPARTLASLVKPHQWFQRSDSVVITEYCKNVSCDQVSISVTDSGSHYTCRVTMPDGSVYTNSLSLFARVESDAHTMHIDHSSYKVEVTLHKSTSMQWPSLTRPEGSCVADDVSSSSSSSSTVIHARDNIIRSHDRASSTYPSSSLKKVDLASVEAELDAMSSSEKPEGDAALHALFQSIYKDANDDTRRAMIKSFQTSGGTVLSTNWNEVKQADYQHNIQPPKGQEIKNWK